MVRVQVGRIACRRDVMHRTWRNGEKEPAVGREPQANQRERDPGAERASHAKKVSARTLKGQLQLQRQLQMNTTG
jgi:hypothetical protein